MNSLKKDIIDFCNEYDIATLAKKLGSSRHLYTNIEILNLHGSKDLYNYLIDLSHDIFPLLRTKYGRMRTKGKDSDDALNAIVYPVLEKLDPLINIAGEIFKEEFTN